MHNPRNEFLSRTQLTPPVRRVMAELQRLTEEAGADLTSRVYASAVAAGTCETWAKTRGLRLSPRHPCLGRLRDGRCWEVWEWRRGESAKERIPCQLPGADHASLWLKAGKPAVYVSQPYHLPWETLQEMMAFAERWHLMVDVESWPSWHFPSRVLTILVRRRTGGEDPPVEEQRSMLSLLDGRSQHPVLLPESATGAGCVAESDGGPGSLRG